MISKVRLKTLILCFTRKTVLLQLFKTKRLNGGVMLIMLLLVCRLAVLSYTYTVSGPPALLSLQYSWLSIVLTTLVIYGCGMLCSNIANRYQFLNVPSHLPTAVFFLLSNFIDRSHSVGPWCFVLIFSVLGFNKLTKAYQKPRPDRNYFDVGFLLGMSSLFYLEYSFFLLAIFICALLLNNFKLRYFTIILISFFMPWVYWFTYLYFTDQFQLFFNSVHEISDQFIWLNFSFWNDLTMSFYYLVILGLLSMLFWFSRRSYLDGYQRPILQISTIFCVISVAIIILLPISQYHILLLLILSLVFLMAYWFFYMNQKLANVLFIITTMLALIYPFIKNINLNL